MRSRLDRGHRRVADLALTELGRMKRRRTSFPVRGIGTASMRGSSHPCPSARVHGSLQFITPPQVAPHRCASRQKQKIFLHFPKQFSLPVAPTGKKSVDARNTAGTFRGRCFVRKQKPPHRCKGGKRGA